MQNNIVYTARIEDAQDVVTFSVEFHRRDLRAIRRAIQTHFRSKLPVERLADGGARITIVSDLRHGASEVRSLYQCFPHLAHLRRQ